MSEQPIDEATALKQRVHFLECLLDDCKLELAGIHSVHPELVDKKLLDEVIDVCDADDSDEVYWREHPTINDPATLKEIQAIMRGDEPRPSWEELKRMAAKDK